LSEKKILDKFDYIVYIILFILITLFYDNIKHHDVYNELIGIQTTKYYVTNDTIMIDKHTGRIIDHRRCRIERDNNIYLFIIISPRLQTVRKKKSKII